MENIKFNKYNAVWRIKYSYSPGGVGW